MNESDCCCCCCCKGCAWIPAAINSLHLSFFGGQLRRQREREGWHPRLIQMTKSGKKTRRPSTFLLTHNQCHFLSLTLCTRKPIIKDVANIRVDNQKKERTERGEECSAAEKYSAALSDHSNSLSAFATELGCWWLIRYIQSFIQL